MIRTNSNNSTINLCWRWFLWAMDQGFSSIWESSICLRELCYPGFWALHLFLSRETCFTQVAKKSLQASQEHCKDSVSWCLQSYSALATGLCVVVDIQPWRHCCVETGLGHGAAAIDLSTGRRTPDRARPACETAFEALSSILWAVWDSMKYLKRNISDITTEIGLQNIILQFSYLQH